MTHSLPPQGPHVPNDPIPGEAELRELYGKLPQNEPGPALDAAVLRAAAEAVSPQRNRTSAEHSPARKIGNRPPRWLIGLGSAATLVLAVGLAWRMRSMPQVENPTSVTEQVSAKASSNSAMDASRVSASTDMPAAAAAPPPPPMPAIQPPPPRILQAARSQGSTKAVAAGANIQTARKQMTADMPPAPSLEARTAVGAVESERAPMATEARSAADKIAAPAPPSISAPPMQPPAPTPELSLSIPPPAPPAPPAETPAPATSPAVQADESQAQDATLAQSAELDAIRQLFVKHHEEEAQRRLEAFHRLHPEWKLSPDLQARLRKP